MTARIMIAMPTTGSIKTPTVSSLLEVVRALGEAGAQVSFRTKDSADVARSRNHLASLALREGATHVLFVDSDMTFTPDLVLKLLNAGRPVVGAICPKRHIDLARLVDLARRAPAGAPAQAIISRALDFVVRWPEGAANLQIQPDGFCKVRAIGMAMTLIEARALQAMIDKGAAPRRPVNFPGEALPTWGFFDPLEDGAGNLLSEDLSFCARWSDRCEGEIWALATAEVGHIGDLVHRGSVLAHYLSDGQLASPH